MRRLRQSRIGQQHSSAIRSVTATYILRSPDWPAEAIGRMAASVGRVDDVPAPSRTRSVRDCRLLWAVLAAERRPHGRGLHSRLASCDLAWPRLGKPGVVSVYLRMLTGGPIEEGAGRHGKRYTYREHHFYRGAGRRLNWLRSACAWWDVVMFVVVEPAARFWLFFAGGQTRGRTHAKSRRLRPPFCFVANHRAQFPSWSTHDANPV